MAKAVVIVSIFLLDAVAAGPGTCPAVPYEHLEDDANVPCACFTTDAVCPTLKCSWDGDTCRESMETVDEGLFQVSTSVGWMLTLSDGADRLYQVIESAVAALKRRLLYLAGSGTDAFHNAANSTGSPILEKMSSASGALKDKLGQAEALLESLTNKSAASISSASDALKDNFYRVKSMVTAWMDSTAANNDDISSIAREEADRESVDDYAVNSLDFGIIGASDSLKVTLDCALDQAEAVLRTVAAIESSTTNAASSILAELDGEASDVSPLQRTFARAGTVLLALRNLTATMAGKTSNVTQYSTAQLSSVLKELERSYATVLEVRSDPMESP